MWNGASKQSDVSPPKVNIYDIANLLNGIDNNIPVLEWLEYDIYAYGYIRAFGRGCAARCNARPVLEWMIKRGVTLEPEHLNYAVRYGHLALVRWMHEEQHVMFIYETARTAARSGNLELLQYVIEKGAELPDDTLDFAAESGSEITVQWLHDKRGLPWTHKVCARAAAGGHLSLVQFLRSQHCEWESTTTYWAATEGRLSVLQWAVEHGCPIKIDFVVLWTVAGRGYLEVLEFLFQHDPEVCSGIDLCILIGSAALGGHFSVLEFLYPFRSKCDFVTITYPIIQCKKPSTLKVIRWLLEQAHWILPSRQQLEEIRTEIRLDVVKYLEENGYLNEKM